MNCVILTIHNAGLTVNPPEAFKPTPERLASLTKGNYVKIRVQADSRYEAFWCEVESVNNNSISVVINQDLQYTKYHGLKDTNKLEIQPENVLSILLQ